MTLIYKYGGNNMDTTVNNYSINDGDLETGAKEFEIFWLRPKKMSGKEAVLRMRITQKWGGWRLKDELIMSMGLEVGDTINAEVSILNGPGLIKDEENVDLFASGESADWLLENDVGLGSVIDAKVKFAYVKAPVGQNGKEVWTASLIFLEGYNVIEHRSTNDDVIQSNETHSLEVLRKLLGD